MTTNPPLDRAAILAMPAGRELNALVAEHVLHWQRSQEFWKGHFWWHAGDGAFICTNDDVPPFSTDIAAAWQVAEKLVRFGLSRCDGGGPWLCRSAFNDAVEADTAPLALCRAALIAAEAQCPLPT